MHAYPFQIIYPKDKLTCVFNKFSVPCICQISTVLKATSDDESAIPGYLYMEVCSILLKIYRGFHKITVSRSCDLHHFCMTE